VAIASSLSLAIRFSPEAEAEEQRAFAEAMAQREVRTTASPSIQQAGA